MTSYSKLKGSHKFSDAIVIYLEQQRYLNITGDYVITIWNLKIQTQAAFYKQMYFKSHVAIMCDVTGAVNISCEIFFKNFFLQHSFIKKGNLQYTPEVMSVSRLPLKAFGLQWSVQHYISISLALPRQPEMMRF